jgi:iron complex transport system ATP-binding protein
VNEPDLTHPPQALVSPAHPKSAKADSLPRDAPFPETTDDVTTTFKIDGDTLVIDLRRRRTILSSAPCGGGLVRARYILNHQVPPNPVDHEAGGSWDDPSRYLSKVAARLGAHGPRVGLMTAVPMTKLVVLREQVDELWVEGFFTVGVSNAVRAGATMPHGAGHAGRATIGTINIILVTNGRLTASAMVGVVQVLTESKTAVLLEEAVTAWDGSPGATGTGTDAVVVASGDGPAVRYSGTHTVLGAMIGKVVSQGMREGLSRYRTWASQHKWAGCSGNTEAR